MVLGVGGEGERKGVRKEPGKGERRKKEQGKEDKEAEEVIIYHSCLSLTLCWGIFS